MGTHPDGTGTGWDACEAVDVDQPEGLDYRYVVHVAKAVRKRNDKEHEAYADTTAGGEHLPGGCRVLGIIDSTADLSASAGIADYDVTTTKFIGRGIIYDQTSNVLWCLTNSDGTTTNDPYALMWGPKSICLDADYSWTGTHEFSSVDISGSLDLTGHFACGSEIVGEISASFSGEVDISQTLNCASDVNVAGGFGVDGTAVFTTEVDVSGNLDVSGAIRVSGDVSNSAFASAWGKADWTTNTLHAGFNVAGVDWSQDGLVCVSFTNSLADANYAVITVPLDQTGGSSPADNFFACCSQSASGFRVTMTSANALANEYSEFYFVVYR